MNYASRGCRFEVHLTRSPAISSPRMDDSPRLAGLDLKAIHHAIVLADAQRGDILDAVGDAALLLALDIHQRHDNRILILGSPGLHAGENKGIFPLGVSQAPPSTSTLLSALITHGEICQELHPLAPRDLPSHRNPPPYAHRSPVAAAALSAAIIPRGFPLQNYERARSKKQAVLERFYIRRQTTG